MTLYQAIKEDERRRAEQALQPYKQFMAQRQTVNPQIVKAAVDLAEAREDIDYLSCDIEDLNELFDIVTEEALMYRNAGNKAKEAKAMQRIVTLRRQLRKAHKDLNKAKLTVMTAEANQFA